MPDLAQPSKLWVTSEPPKTCQTWRLTLCLTQGHDLDFFNGCGLFAPQLVHNEPTSPNHALLSWSSQPSKLWVTSEPPKSGRLGGSPCASPKGMIWTFSMVVGCLHPNWSTMNQQVQIMPFCHGAHSPPSCGSPVSLQKVADLEAHLVPHPRA